MEAGIWEATSSQTNGTRDHLRRSGSFVVRGTSHREVTDLVVKRHNDDARARIALL